MGCRSSPWAAVRAAAEPLEPRRLLAFSAADYFPLAAGHTWSYAGSIDDVATTSAAATTVRHGPFTRVNFHAVIGSTEGYRSSSFYTLDADGLWLHLFEGIDDDPGEADVESSFVFAQPLLMIQSHAQGFRQMGTVPTTATIRDKETGETYTLTGTTTGQATQGGIDPHERIALPDGRYILGWRIDVSLAYNLTGTISGVPVSVMALDTIGYWLGLGMGVVKQEQISKIELSSPALGGRIVDSASFEMAMTAGSHVPPDLASIANGTLTVTGGAGRDVISIEGSGSKTTVTHNGVSEDFDSGQITAGRSVFGGAGNDSVTIGLDTGAAYVDAGEGNDSILGSGAGDTLTGGAGKDRIDGRFGHDRINGNGGHDHLIGGSGDDRLYGGNENDTIEGGAGIDRAWGGAGDDAIAGNGSNDKLFGDAGNDTLGGGTHDDRLDGGAGNDQLFGGDGIDTFFLQDGFPDTADGGDDADLLEHADASDQLIDI